MAIWDRISFNVHSEEWIQIFLSSNQRLGILKQTPLLPMHWIYYDPCGGCNAIVSQYMWLCNKDLLCIKYNCGTRQKTLGNGKRLVITYYFIPSKSVSFIKICISTEKTYQSSFKPPYIKIPHTLKGPRKTHHDVKIND